MGPGDRIGRYVVEALLGEGGMGQVYRAYDATLNRRVAIKLLRPDDAESGVSGSGATSPSAARIQREAQMAAALDHPNVVSIFDVGEEKGMPFIVMELVIGRPLRACVGHPEIPVAERVHWLIGIARGLGAAHQAGLVHRDVKPENVLVRSDGVVKVLDFGIARLEHRPSQSPPPTLRAGGSERALRIPTPTALESTLAGTPAYMAPEQIRRERVDARVDQFAWGVVAYELLTGRLPWEVKPNQAGLLLAVLEQEAPALDAAALGVAESFVTTVGRALSKRRDARFGSMDELLLATGLAWSQGELPTLAPRPSLPSNPGVPSSGGFAPDIASAPTLLATSSAGGLSAAALTAGSRERKPSRGRWLASGGAAVAASLALFFWHAIRSPAGKKDAVAESLPNAKAPSAPFAFHPHDARRLTFDQGCEEYPSLSPDGAAVAFDTASGEDIHVVVLDLATGTQRQLTHEPGWHFSPVIAPDGKTVAYLRQHRDEVGTWVVPLDGSAPARKLATGRMRPSWSPDGAALWAGPADAPQRIDLATGAVTRTLTPPAGYYIVRGRELEGGRVVARLLDRETKRGRGLSLYTLTGSSSPLFPDVTEDALALAPDGSRLLVPKLLLPTERVELWQVPLDGSPASVLSNNVVLPTKGMDVARDGSAVVWSTCSTEQDLASLGDGSDPKAPA
ncbi:MAG TPA: protein kinase, partial [Polyangiaceae bacterium]